MNSPVDGRQRLASLIVFGLALLLSIPALAAEKPAIVLVHGAFADGSSWAKVIPILQAKGYNVTAVQNPLTSFADDVAATRRALAQQEGPVIQQLRLALSGKGEPPKGARQGLNS